MWHRPLSGIFSGLPYHHYSYLKKICAGRATAKSQGRASLTFFSGAARGWGLVPTGPTRTGENSRRKSPEACLDCPTPIRLTCSHAQCTTHCLPRPLHWPHRGRHAETTPTHCIPVVSFHLAMIKKIAHRSSHHQRINRSTSTHVTFISVTLWYQGYNVGSFRGMFARTFVNGRG